MSTEGLEGRKENLENLENFKKAIYFLSRENIEYLESVEYIMNNYEKIIIAMSYKINNNFLNLKTCLKYFKFSGFLILLNLPFYFTIPETIYKLIFITINTSVFLIFFFLYLVLKVTIRKN